MNNDNKKYFARVEKQLITTMLGCWCLLPLSAWADQAPETTAPSTTLAQTTIGLLFVLGLLMLLAWLLKRAGLGTNAKRGGFYKVLATSSLGPRERIVLVEVGDTWLVLGITSQSINTLHSMPAGSIHLESAVSPAATFAKLLERVKNPKVNS
jgi:flagellar protein FliO/FliZ